MTSSTNKTLPAQPGSKRAAIIDGLWWLIVILLLALSGVLGALASLFALICALILGFLAGPRALLSAAREPFAIFFLTGFTLMSVTTLVTSRGPGDALNVFNFVPMVLALPVFAVARTKGDMKTLKAVVTLCFIGVVAALAVGIIDLFFLGKARSEGFLNNAIIYGHTTAVVGFMGLGGYFLFEDRRRHLFLLAPLLGAIVLVMSGTRGGMLALPGAFIVSFIAILYTSKNRLRVGLAGALALIVLIASAYLVQSETHGRVESLFDVVPSLIWGDGGNVDRSTAIRLRMYEGGARAFLDSPVIGHGWANMMEAASIYLTEREARQVLNHHSHLHNDLLNFAAASGIAGVASLMLFLSAPLVQIIARRRTIQHVHVPLSYFAAMTAIYGVAGLFFMTLGFDISTTIFALTTALVAGLYMRPPEP